MAGHLSGRNELGEFEYPIGVGMDLEHIYVADPQNHRIQIFDQQGERQAILRQRGPGEQAIASRAGNERTSTFPAGRWRLQRPPVFTRGACRDR